MLKASLIIPSFNGKELLQQHLGGVVQAARQEGDCEVLVVDDGSTDGSRQWVAEAFPAQVRVVGPEQQGGFIAAANLGAEQAAGEAVVLLNNDVGVEPGFLAPLLDALDEQTFAATCRSVTDKDQNEGLSVAFFEDGDLVVVQPGVEMQDTRHDRRCTNFHASGGFSAFCRRRWLELGGLDPIFHPFYWEDVDICFRAWKRGWRCLYIPESRVKHQPHSTISAHYDAEQVRRTYEGNKHTFIMKNISDPDLFSAYVRRLSRDLFDRPRSPGEQRRQWGAFEMLKRARATMARRGKLSNGASAMSDAEVLARSANVPC